MKNQLQPPGRKQLKAITRIFAVLLAFSTLVVVGLVLFSLRGQDEVAKRDSVHLTRSLLVDLRKRLSDQLLDYSYWDEAAVNLVERTNASWADNNIGIYMNERFAIDASFVIDRNGKITYAMRNGRRLTSDQYPPIEPDMAALLARARETPATKPPVPVSGFVEIDGRIHVASASVLTYFPENANADGVIGTGWTLVFTKELNADRLAAISENYLLSNLRIIQAKDDVEDAHLNIVGLDGRRLGVLTWSTASPSSEILPWLAAVIVLIFVAFGILALVFFQRSQSIMNTLSVNIAELRSAHQARNDALIEAREANEAKTKFLTSMSHELRTPLNAIMGLADMQRHKVFGPVGNPRYEEYAEDIHASADHLLKLINDVLDISAIEAGKMNVEMNFIPIASVVDKCVPMIRQVAEKKGIRFSLDVEDGLPEFYGHDRSITQILINLLNNAVKYTPAGGEIGLAIRWENGGHVIVVKDTGMGIAPHKLPMITDPYTRFHEDESAKIEGTGLGLSITKELVQIHGGRIDIDSVVGRGTVVTITFRGVTSGQISLFDEKDV